VKKKRKGYRRNHRWLLIDIGLSFMGRNFR
jgi:hypothetical protein